MKLFIVLCVLMGLAFAANRNLSEELLQAREECFKIAKVPSDYIEKFKKFEFPDDEASHCYIACILQKFDFFTPTEGFKTANMVTFFGGSMQFKADLDKCTDNNEQKSDPCTWAFRGFQCFIKSHPM